MSFSVFPALFREIRHGWLWGRHATQEAVDNLSKQMYLDKPLPVQYILWFRDVLHGDFGISLSTRRSVTEDMKQLLPATFELIFWSALFMVGGSLILGRAAARHRDGILDSIIRVFSYIGIAVPSFVVAIVLLVIFGNLWQVIPTLGRLSTGVAPPDTITGFYVLDALVQGQFSTAWTRSSICCCPRLPFLWAVCSRMHG